MHALLHLAIRLSLCPYVNGESVAGRTLVTVAIMSSEISGNVETAAEVPWGLSETLAGYVYTIGTFPTYIFCNCGCIDPNVLKAFPCATIICLLSRFLCHAALRLRSLRVFDYVGYYLPALV